MSEYKVYLIESGDRKRTYVGLTKDFKKRLRQHNGEIKGGARYTRKGTDWRLRCLISGFGTDTQARMLEWRLHHPKKRLYDKPPLYRRIVELNESMKMPRWTKNCTDVKDIKNLAVTFEKLDCPQLELTGRMSWPENVVVIHKEQE